MGCGCGEKNEIYTGNIIENCILYLQQIYICIVQNLFEMYVFV